MAVAVIPAWVVPPAREISDLHWLAWRAVADSGSHHAGGVEHVLVWLDGEVDAPITGRPGRPAARETAEVELRAAGAALDPSGALRGLVAEELGLATWAPPPRHPDWTRAVYDTLRWLLGAAPRAPIEVPARLADGRTPTAEELYEQAVRAEPWRFSLPEQRADLRVQTERDAARHRRLVELIEDTQRLEQRYTAR